MLSALIPTRCFVKAVPALTPTPRATHGDPNHPPPAGLWGTAFDLGCILAPLCVSPQHHPCTPFPPARLQLRRKETPQSSKTTAWRSSVPLGFGAIWVQLWGGHPQRCPRSSRRARGPILKQNPPNPPAAPFPSHPIAGHCDLGTLWAPSLLCLSFPTAVGSGAARLSPIPPAEIREAFKVFDRDGNGFISKQELGTAMRSLGYMPNEVELEVIIQRLDMDGRDPCGAGWDPGATPQQSGAVVQGQSLPCPHLPSLERIR